jgi:sulfatase modifying factor 1
MRINADYFLPSVDEWYKGAYYDPNKGGRGVGGYWKYPTGSDAPPTPVSGGTDPNTAVYNQWFDKQYRDPADVNNAGGLSPYGTMAHGGQCAKLE